MKREFQLLLLLTAFIFLVGILNTQGKASDSSIFQHLYFGQVPPGENPEIFLFEPIASSEKLNLKVVRLSKNAIIVSVDGQYSNQLALSTDKGIVVFDTHWSRSAATEYQEVIAKEFNRNDFAYVILTGSRIIRVAGTPQYPEAMIIALERCYESMLQNNSRLEELIKQDIEGFKNKAERSRQVLKTLDPDAEEAQAHRSWIPFCERLAHDLENEEYNLILPSIVFNDRMTVDLGNMTLKLFHFGNGVLFAYIPEEGILMPGNGFHPAHVTNLTAFPQSDGYEVTKWLEVLDEVLDSGYDLKHIVLGFSDIWKREDLVSRREYIRKLWQAVTEATEKGLSYEEAKIRFSLENDFSFVKELGFYKESSHDWWAEDHAKNLSAFWSEHHPSAAKIVKKQLQAFGIESAIEKYREMKEDSRNRYFFVEQEFNSLGYEMMASEKWNEAIEIFKIGLDAFPESANLYDSLGEAYMRSGDKEKAILNYKKSLELNPNNKNAEEMLKKLKIKK